MTISYSNSLDKELTWSIQNTAASTAAAGVEQDGAYRGAYNVMNMVSLHIMLMYVHYNISDVFNVVMMFINDLWV